MPKEVDRAKLTFPNSSALFNSYSAGAFGSSQLPQEISKDIQNCMVNYSGNPLIYREGFLFDDKENLPLKPLWLGVELEVSPSDKGIKEPGFFYKVASTLRNFAIIKPDGSLPSGGFEICSVPATLIAHRAIWAEFFAQAAPLLKSWTNGGHGMHVHMSKAFFSASDTGKAMVFVNSHENGPFIEKVAGRYATTYTKFHPKKFGDARNGRSSNHYDALSVSGHTGTTLELRIFRGNVSHEGFMKNLDFTDALGHFVKDTSAKELGSADFLRWISQPAQRVRYPYFVGWAKKTKQLKGKEASGKTTVEMPKVELPTGSVSAIEKLAFADA